MIKKVKVLIATFSQPKYLFSYAFLILLLLLFRNPFSQRTLIPNLEPYPDTIHYLTPARSFVMGGPFKIIREGRTTDPGVSPLYSTFLIPFYFINIDVRVFYIANVLLSLTSLILFFWILKKITEDKWIIGFTLFLFATNFFVYWYPQWAMAENLILPLYLGGVVLLVSKTSIVNLLLAGFVSASFYGVKYASVPLTAVYGLLYFIKIIFDLQGNKNLLFKKLGIYVLFLTVFLVGIVLYGYSINGVNPVSGIISIIRAFFGKITQGVSSVAQVSNPWMSVMYVKTNLPMYLNGLIGRSERFLWDFTPLVPVWVGVSGVIGLIAGCFTPQKTRYLSISLIALLLSQILFMSMFYAVDMRYIYFAIPTLLLGFSLLLGNLRTILMNRRVYSVFALIIFVAFGYYFFGNALRIKNQIVLNIKYAETPWYYISVLKLNEYFVQENIIKPVVISPMPPYYIDYYSNGNYRLLPLSPVQEFRSGKVQAWGDYNYSDLHGVYRKVLEEGGRLYVSTYGLGNEAYLHRAFDDLRNDFVLKEVSNNCYELCKIYKLELKNGKNI